MSEVVPLKSKKRGREITKFTMATMKVIVFKRRWFSLLIKMRSMTPRTGRKVMVDSMFMGYLKR
jgi:hypothetical protein